MSLYILHEDVYISKTFNMLYFLDENNDLREISLGINGEVSSYEANIRHTKLSVIKGRTKEPSHNRMIKICLIRSARNRALKFTVGG